MRQAWTISPGTPVCRKSGSTKAALEEFDDSRRGTREGGKVNAALFPVTGSNVDVGFAVDGTETVGVARVLATGGAARELAVPAVPGAADVNAGADAPPGFPPLLLLV